MRPILFTVILSPILRILARRTLPTLEYPVCRSSYTCTAPPRQDFKNILMDLNKERMGEAESLAGPVKPCDGEMLGKNDVHDEALKTVVEEKKKEEVKLPKLSAADFRAYNKMAERMDYFHNHFRQSWTILYNACTANKRPSNLSLKQFINTGIQLCSHLGAHHSIEEQHVFPILAAKMPEFKAGRNAAELLRQHKQIHDGMDVFEEYLEKCRSGEIELELRVMKEKMDSWGGVLWKHLDQEVKTLGAENMRKYWTLEEMRRMPL